MDGCWLEETELAMCGNPAGQLAVQLRCSKRTVRAIPPPCHSHPCACPPVPAFPNAAGLEPFVSDRQGQELATRLALRIAPLFFLGLGVGSQCSFGPSQETLKLLWALTLRRLH